MRRGSLILLFTTACAMPPVHAQADLQQLQQQLAQRDALIQDLLRRVQALEQRQGAEANAASTSAPAAAPRPATPVAGAVAEEDETARALERALVREGGFVLPRGAVEVEPRYQYTYNGSRGLAIVQGPAGAQVVENTAQRHRHEASVGLRIGLPWTSQLAIRAPYVRARNSTAAVAVGLDRSESASGAGDLEVQFTKQLTNEAGGRPALLGSVTWKADNGDFSPGRPSPGSGFPSLQLGLTAVKRQDPLVFFGGVSYTAFRARSHGGSSIEPAPGVGVKFGTLLAATPETSLRAGLDLTRSGRIRVNGAATPGSETLSGIVELGLSSLVAKNTLLDLTLGFGVTPDAPKLRLGVSLPVRFP